ncbi:hypothetical protein [Sebaldella sp. S0638]|uniref:hypothetical protein n=1 Tax=Sebaldella sp. S0638 TaxID=2957809 RepID=UPI00209E8CD2|nr:hypothetical protein [Sebaldella sp. S0638]MCP1225704.1 hypothetical protein [Sebaldella sp. S0638]
MEKLKGIEIIGVVTIANKVNLMLAVIGSKDWWTAEVQKDKKGSYIKLSNKHVNIAETTVRKKHYIKGELWWAVNRFEKYLEEGE